MADTLDNLLNESVQFHDFKLWLVSDSAENCCEKADFISYFLNYIREKCAWLISKNIKGLESPSLKGRSREFSYPADSRTLATKFPNESTNRSHNNEIHTKFSVSFNNRKTRESDETKLKRTEFFNDESKFVFKDRTPKPSCLAKKSLKFDCIDGAKSNAHSTQVFKENINNFDDFPPLDHKSSNVSSKDVNAFPPFDRRPNNIRPRDPKARRRITPTPIQDFNRGTTKFGPSKFATPTEKLTNEVFQKTPYVESPSSNLQNEREMLKIKKNIFPQTTAVSSISKLGNTSPVKSVTMHYIIPELEKVSHKKLLEEFSSVYETLITNGLVPNVTSELYFVFELLTSKLLQNQMPNDSDTRSNIFCSIHNCTYFGVTVLSKLQNLLNLLDKNTLSSLCEVPFLSQFSPQLVDFLNSCCEDKQEITFKSQSLNRVPFLVEEDSKENFIDNRAFASFRKQRDLFYELLRDWQQQSLNNMDVKFQENFSRKAKLLISLGPNAVNMFHLARLFQNQMIASCLGLEVNEVLYDELLIDIQKNFPGKFEKLRERFMMPFCVGEPNPPPTFYGIQLFFSELIIAASSSILNQQLQDIIVCKILDLNEADIFSDEELSSLETVKEKYIFLLHTLRLLGKFLGYLYFLPYKVSEPLPASIVNSQLKARKYSMPPLDVLKLLKKAVENNRVILTVPWIVEYLSMIDPVSKNLTYIEETLGILVSIYRGQYIFSSNCINFWFLRIMIGWLFDVLQYPSKYSSLLQPVVFEKNVKCEGLDFLAIINKQLLHSCCPYLMEFKVLVHSFLNGIKKDRKREVRKITPVSTSKPRVATPLTKHQTEIQLEENFFFLHPPSLKKTVEFVSERMVSKVINRIRSEITEFKLHSIEHIISQENYQNLLNSQPANAVKLKSFIDSSILELYEKSHSKIESFIKIKCLEDIENIIPSLLADDIKPTVVETCCKISFRHAVDKITDWCDANLILLEIQKDIKNKLNHLSKGESEVAALKEVSIGSVIDNLRQSVIKIHSAVDITDELTKLLSEVSNLVNKDIGHITKKLIIFLTVDLYIAVIVFYPEKCDLKLNSSFIPVWSQCMKVFDLESYFMGMQNMKYLLIGKNFELTAEKFIHILSCLLSDKIFEVARLRNCLLKLKEFHWSENDARIPKIFEQLSSVLDLSEVKETANCAT